MLATDAYEEAYEILGEVEDAYIEKYGLESYRNVKMRYNKKMRGL